jgi:hypothetical protein
MRINGICDFGGAECGIWLDSIPQFSTETACQVANEYLSIQNFTRLKSPENALKMHARFLPVFVVFVMCNDSKERRKEHTNEQAAKERTQDKTPMYHCNAPFKKTGERAPCTSPAKSNYQLPFP